MSRDPIQTATQIWTSLHRGVDRAVLLAVIAGMVVVPGLIILDSVGTIDVFDSPVWWNLLVGGFMMAIGVSGAWIWVSQKLAAARALHREDGV